MGGRSTQADDAWTDLLANISVRVSQEELNRNGNHRESVDLPQGGHMAWIGVFHQLHCLVSIERPFQGKEDI